MQPARWQLPPQGPTAALDASARRCRRRTPSMRPRRIRPASGGAVAACAVPPGAGSPRVLACPRPHAQRPGSPRPASAEGPVQRVAQASVPARVLPGSGDRLGSCVQSRTQLVHRIAQPRFHGFPANAGDLADLLQAQFLFQPQLQHFTLFCGQLFHRQLDAATLFEFGQFRFRGLPILQRGQAQIGIGRCRGAMAGGAPVVVQAVVGDAEQPGAEGRVGLPACPRADHPLPDVLEHLLGQRGVAQLPQQEAEQALAMTCIQAFERVHVTGGPGQHQGFIGWQGAGIHAVQGKPCRQWRIAGDGVGQGDGHGGNRRRSTGKTPDGTFRGYRASIAPRVARYAR